MDSPPSEEQREAMGINPDKNEENAPKIDDRIEKDETTEQRQMTAPFVDTRLGENVSEPRISELGFNSVEGSKSSNGNSDRIELDKESRHPLDKRVPLTSSIIKDNKKKLGIINLFWPTKKKKEDHTSSIFHPLPYSTNSNKEKVLLLYAENFRRQFHTRYPTRKPLLLAAENGCGIQKMVSTSIRPTKLCYPEFHSWQGCAAFVSDHVTYQPLECPQQMPARLASGRSVLARQEGNCFEMSALLVSYLLAAGYDAYVASGYATQYYCQNNLTRTSCPDVPDIAEKQKPAEPTVESKYTVRPPRDLRSKFIMETEQRKRDEEEAEVLRLLEEERIRIAELEKPPHDPVHWWGVHSWVVILPGRREVEKVVFIHPGSGVASGPDDPCYLGIESVWNHANYWVNVQNCATCQDLQFELRDPAFWEHLLPGEPWHWQKVAKDVDFEEQDITLLEKHLDMPLSWVEPLRVSNSTYEQRYPLGAKFTYYKKALVEKFAPYLHEDGLVCRVTTFEDYECEVPEVEYEMYSNRVDCLFRKIRYINPEVVIDEYDRGREDALMKQFIYEEENRRVMLFYHQIRFDHLKRLELTPEFMEEQFEGRDDQLYQRYVSLDQRTKALNKWSLTEGTTRRTVTRINERFNRNEAVSADRDIARREFDITNDEVHISYHYAEGRITSGTRFFIKPPVADQGDRLKFDSKLTSGYVADTAAAPQKKMELFLLLDECLRAEQDAQKHIRDMEDEIVSILRNIALETTEPKLKISIFDQERNGADKDRMKKREQHLLEESAKEVEADTDFLAVYLIQFVDGVLSHPNSLEVRNYCLEEYRQLLVDRANKMQFKFDRITEELQAKHLWYENLGPNVGHDEEDDYIEEVRRLAFSLHTLELRLLRHRELAPARYTALDAWIAGDPRLNLIP